MIFTVTFLYFLRIVKNIPLRKFFLIIQLLSVVLGSAGQTVGSLEVKVLDAVSKEPLPGVTITVFREGKPACLVTNNEGRFVISRAMTTDSIQMTMIGYGAEKLPLSAYRDKLSIVVLLHIITTELSEVVVRPLQANEIVEQAIRATRLLLPAQDFSNKIFYREIIRDREQYFSVAEAIFETQYTIAKKSFKLRMLKGRSKEDVNYTRLFEDYHPGGGPQELAAKYFSIAFPDFLTLSKTKWFNYKKEKSLMYNGSLVYDISFDQKPDIHEALEKGHIYIMANDFSIISYDAANSPLGIAYIKDLKGTDKIFAEILNIDFKRKGWKRQVAFAREGDRLVLSRATAVYQIGYKQPKKNLDLDLTISTELLATERLLPITRTVTKTDEWKRGNLVANLPTYFDPGFWGDNNIISPTQEVDTIIASIGKRNGDVSVSNALEGWQYFKKDYLVTVQQQDSIILVPVIKGSWEDEETAGMIYKNIDGDFTVETNLSISKMNNPGEWPENGFQQAGIIIRDVSEKEENNLIFCAGTGGNGQPKIFLRKTMAGVSKGPVDKIDAMNCILRLVKKGKEVSVYYRQKDTEDWKKITVYQLNWLKGTAQVGLMAMARFAGSGPKAKPDMRAVFTHFTITPG